MNKTVRHILLLLCSVLALPAFGTDFVLRRGEPLAVLCAPDAPAPIPAALELFGHDYRAVFGADLRQPASGKGLSATMARLIITTLGNEAAQAATTDLSPLEGKSEAFLLHVDKAGRLWIVGSDKRGTAYGLMQLSRLLGVSPWEWWADATPLPREEFRLPEGYCDVQSPSVAYRGIFINDEDWGLNPWSSTHYEPSATKGEIGPKTHARIFELLLRLRANTFWPAMHECSVPFFFTEGNRQTAERYGIYIGTSHCEPMLRNTNGEWRRDGVGEYDFVHNSEQVLKFWEKRVDELAQGENIFTLGMRGVHDGAMNGARTVEEQKAVLTDVIRRQRKMIRQKVSEDVSTVPQVFIPYKEVLDVYHAGLEVPDDVTLIWTDDNYGFIRHFPTAEERARRGGNGIYYHTSYWGRPHDYLWIGGTAPALLFHQMSLAYDRGIRRMWILNVGDIKPLEYQTELFLDMAWDIEAVKREGVRGHLRGFLAREFGEERADTLQAVMEKHRRLEWMRRPEFLGATRTEERDPAYKVVSDLPWSETSIRRRLDDYRALADAVEALKADLAPTRREAYFQLVEYPVKAAAQMNRKLLTAQLARHGRADWTESDAAYDSIASLTRLYNQGKWEGIMDFHPRRLPVYDRVARTTSSRPLPEERTPLLELAGADYAEGEATLWEELGYSGRSVGLTKGCPLAYRCAWTERADSVGIEVGLVATHPVEGDRLRFTLRMDDGEPHELSYATQGRSEEWKENILRGEAVRRILVPTDRRTVHRLELTALDEGVTVDRIRIFKPNNDYIENETIDDF